MSTVLIKRAEAAAIAGFGVRHLQRLDKEPDGPPWTGKGYDAERFGQWLRRQWLRGMGVEENGRVYDYEQERARLTKAQADKTELEARELRGELARADEVIDTWSRHVGSCRARLLSLPGKTAPRARAAGSDEEAAKLIEVEVLEALEELATDGLPDRTRARRERVPARVETAAVVDGKRVGRRRKKAES